jgi:hypothetical protein
VERLADFALDGPFLLLIIRVRTILVCRCLGLLDGLYGLLHVALVPEGRQKGAGDSEKNAERR